MYSAKKRIITTFVVFIVLWIVFMSYMLRISIREALVTNMSIAIERETERIDRVFDDFKTNLKTIEEEYGQWDLAYNAMVENDQEWLEDNMLKFLIEDNKYKLDMVYLSNGNGVERYHGAESFRVLLDGIGQDTGVVEYIIDHDALYMIYATSVYNNKLTQGLGRFVLGYKIDENYIYNQLANREFSKLMSVKMLEAGDDIEIYGNNRTKRLEKIEVLYVIKDIESNGQLLKRFVFAISFEGSNRFANTLFQKIHFAMLISVFILLMLIIALVVYVTDKLKMAVDQIDQVAQGNYKYKLGNYKSSEIHQLFSHIDKLSETVTETIDELQQSRFDAILMLINTIEAKDNYTKGHSERVNEISIILGKNCKNSDGEKLKIAAMLHDVGKIGIPEIILNKKEALTTEEYELIKEHSEKGYQILGNIKYLEYVAKIVRQHHERPDGKGYPLGLKADEIVAEAKIIQVADTLDAITSDRPYRSGRSVEEAIAIINKEAGKQFDTDVVEHLNASRDEIETYIKLNRLSIEVVGHIK